MTLVFLLCYWGSLLFAVGLLFLGGRVVKRYLTSVPSAPRSDAAFLGAIILRSVLLAVLAVGGSHALLVLLAFIWGFMYIRGVFVSPLIGLGHALFVVLMVIVTSAVPQARRSIWFLGLVVATGALTYSGGMAGLLIWERLSYPRAWEDSFDPAAPLLETAWWALSWSPFPERVPFFGVVGAGAGVYLGRWIRSQSRRSDGTD